ncbi:copper chaperone CopZ [Planococcus lenghuensis]|uniref:Copper chaperone CopZ n=1 Tax=Planococcus lenghuensis TaxID=2213202 RepID=A0A1Q2L4C6_9BACL|nr:copper chaperone CopZ [Planococcus lenghuensis]AQQ55289.1 copper-binding protein [Planococcus lenghuensis]
MEQTTLQINGMTCGHCKAAVDGALRNLQGVQNVQVDVAKGVAEVTYNNSEVTTKNMKEAVEEQGYDVR